MPKSPRQRAEAAHGVAEVELLLCVGVYGWCVHAFLGMCACVCRRVRVPERVHVCAAAGSNKHKDKNKKKTRANKVNTKTVAPGAYFS
jgi:hypothetical protein